MDPHALFALSGPLALIGWGALLAAPLVPKAAQWIAGLLVPVFFSIAYAALMLVNWSDAPGGYGSLADVMALFTVPEIALAGWLHYLAFDLCVGAWQVRVAQREGISHMLVIPCLVFAFLFGPVGFVFFAFLRAAKTLTKDSTHA